MTEPTASPQPSAQPSPQTAPGPVSARLVWAIYADALDLLVRATLSAVVIGTVASLAMLFLGDGDDPGLVLLVGLGSAGLAFLTMLGLRAHRITTALMQGGTPPFYVNE